MEEAVDRPQNARSRKGQDAPCASIFQRIEKHHRRHRDETKDREGGHRIRSPYRRRNVGSWRPTIFSAAVHRSRLPLILLSGSKWKTFPRSTITWIWWQDVFPEKALSLRPDCLSTLQNPPKESAALAESCLQIARKREINVQMAGKIRRRRVDSSVLRQPQNSMILAQRA